MKVKFSLVYFLIAGPCIFSFSQTINQFDSNGKKDGKWKLYYDQYWRVSKDSSNAAYYWFTYYDHGIRVYTEADWGCKTCRYRDSVFSKQEAKIKLLDGKYTWCDKKGNLFSEHYFVKGEPLWWKQYHANGKLYLYFDYTKKCEGEALSWTLTEYDKKGNLKSTVPISKGCGGSWGGIK